ncbi:SusC/RagA family TonB-linked outer membrane protein [Luteirhabdus pelagi]|uniref:SusC/RagA family TonB-linked outer membrane protein n=1 Tax=Luteirhabdus pelagi TaxID=2792783 RepID=UPI00193993B2|nr:SusC/RagA family TonB-linked outer membrane protein [Luteirhabdus pelagi]
MKTKLLYMLCLFLLGSFAHLLAQQTSITGNVSDQDGLPLPGVNILVKGTSTGTQTDFDGNYSISASSGQILVYSYIGYKKVERAVSNTSSNINVQMEEDSEQLGEVVLNAIGLKRKKEDDLSSSTLVPVEAVTRSGEAGLLQGMAGKTSGVNIIRSSGDPGAGAFIQIRGANTILGNDEPLVVIDGVLIDNRNFESGVDGVTEQSRLNDIPAEDIENIQIIKGAQAVAVYGTGAANGVILITTKTGKTGAGKNWQLNYKTALYVDTVNEEWDLQDQWGQGIDGNYRNMGGERNTWGDLISARPGGPDGVIEGLLRFEAEDGTIYYPLATRDDGTLAKNSREVFLESNRDAILGNGYTFENSLSLQRASENGSTYISANTWKQNGVIQGNSSYYRRAFRFNNTTDFSDKISARVSASYTKTSGDLVQTGSNLNGLYLGYLRTSPDFDIRDYKGTAYDANGNATINAQRAYRNPLGPTSAYNNPLWTANEQSNTQEVDRIIITPELTYKFSENVSLTARYNIDTYRDLRRTFFPINSATNVGNGNGYLQIDERFVNTQYFTAFLNSNFLISDNFNFNTLLGLTYEESSLENIGGTLLEFAVPNITLSDLIDIENGTSENNDAFDFYTYRKQVGVYAVVEGEAFNQLLFNFSGRLDRSSTLNNQNFFYPGIALGWKFSELTGTSDFFSFGKLRATYGEVAVAPIPYSLSQGFVGGGVASSWGDALNGSQFGTLSSRENSQGNPNLQVERVKEFEVGADFKFINNRINLSATYYNRETEDALLQRNVAPSSGYTTLVSNAANISNEGLEIDLGGTIIQTDRFRWSVNANYSFNDNLVTSPDGNGEQIVALNGFTGSVSAVYDGEPFAVFAGNPLQRDENGDILLSEFGFPLLDNEAGEVVLGDPNPDWRGGLGTLLEFDGLRLSAQFDAMQGMDVWNGTKGVLYHFGVHEDTANIVTVSEAEAQSIVNYDGTPIAEIPYAWQNGDGSYSVRGNLYDFGSGTVLLDQIWYNEGTASGFAGSPELYVEDASYIKLRELTVGYSFPKRFTDTMGVSSLDVSVSGRNLITWSDIEGFDPDNNLTGASKGRGLEYFTNPSTSSYIFTIRLGL